MALSTLVVTWEDHRRTRELCAGLGLELVVQKSRYRGFRRYLELSRRTRSLLAARDIDVLLVTNPSLILSALSVVLARVYSFRLFVDAHNEAVTPFINPQWWIRRLSRWVLRHSDLTIVTNPQLATLVSGYGGRPFVLPDRIPTPPVAGAMRSLAAGFTVVLIATYASDEPIAEVFEAVRGSDIQLYVTGNARKLDTEIRNGAPANVHFTGFLEEGAYWDLLRSADAIIDLSLIDDCLVCGAYEALALAKPMVLSRNAASVELFGEAAVFTDNTSADIRRALSALRSRYVQIQDDAQHKTRELTERWDRSAKDLAALIVG
jgi:glycosyltransferase involved in cell wall biosynthesis